MFQTLVARIALALSRRTGIHLSRVVVRVPQGARIESPGCEVQCRTVRLSELALSWPDPLLELTEEHARSACERGDVCVGAYVADRMVGYMWIALGRTPHLAGMWVEMDHADCYFYKKFVHPSFRGLRISDALDTEADKVALRLGRNRVLGFIDLQNMPSWKALKRRGARTAGYVGYFTWFGRSVSFRTRGAARSGFKFSIPRQRRYIRPEISSA